MTARVTDAFKEVELMEAACDFDMTFCGVLEGHLGTHNELLNDVKEFDG